MSTSKKKAAAVGKSVAPGPPVPKKTPGKCDLCTKKDGFQDMKLLRCRMCSVCVHETCYGLPPSSDTNSAGQSSASTDPTNWICNACDAVGKTFVVSRKGHPTKTMTQRTRPTDCALCPVVDGENVAEGAQPFHAMHKLYDTHGPNGRQVVLKADHKRNLPERLGWVHSACAYGISSSRIAGGCVYGCLEDGTFDGDGGSDEDEEDEEESDFEETEWIGGRKQHRHHHGSPGGSPRKSKKKKANDDGDDDEDDAAGDIDTGAIHHFVICHKENGRDTFWTNTIKDCRALKCFLCGNQQCPPTHIPLQCTANDDQEFHEHKPRHDDKSPCFTAFHIGCARGWDSRHASSHPRVYFFPGSPGADETGHPPVNEMYCSRHAKEVFDNAPKRKRQLQEQFKPRQQMAKSTRALSRAGGGDADAVVHVPLGRRGLASTKIRPTAPAAAAAAARASRPVTSSPAAAAAKKKREQSPAQKKQPEKDWFDDIRDDVIKIIRSTQAKGGNVIEATNKVKAHWKDPEQRSRMGMTKREFNAIWERVKDAVSQMPELQVDTPSTSNGSAAGAATTEEVDPWSSIWESGGTSFEFGDWDTEELSSST